VEWVIITPKGEWGKAMQPSARRVLAIVLCLMALGSCTSGEHESSQASTPKASTTTTRPGQVVASTSTLPASADGEAAADLVARAKGRLPYPDDVLDCVARRATEDEDLRAALEKPGAAANLAVADGAAASCVIEVRAAPRFAEDLQRAAGGGLTEKQLACAVREFGRLTSAEVEAAAGAVLNPEKAEAAATAPVEEIYSVCDIDVGDR